MSLGKIGILIPAAARLGGFTSARLPEGLIPRWAAPRYAITVPGDVRGGGGGVNLVCGRGFDDATLRGPRRVPNKGR